MKIICNNCGSVSFVLQLRPHVKVVLQVRSALAVSSGRYESFTAAQMAALFHISVIRVIHESSVTYKRLVPASNTTQVSVFDLIQAPHNRDGQGREKYVLKDIPSCKRMSRTILTGG